MTKSITTPPVGQSFIDDEGLKWVVRNVIQSQSLPGFFLVRLEHGAVSDGPGGTIVLAPAEFQALIRARGFKALGPDVTPAIARRPIEKATSDGLHISLLEPGNDPGGEAQTAH